MSRSSVRFRSQAPLRPGRDAPRQQRSCPVVARRLLPLLVAVLALTLPSAPGAAAQQPAPEDGCGPEPTEWATTYTDVGIRMRDGVCLRANLWLPDTPGRYPVVFAMTPYRKDD